MDRSVNRLKSCFKNQLSSACSERVKSDKMLEHLVICEFRFISTMLLLCDTLPHVSHLSKCFQIQDCDYSIIPKMLSSTIACLEQLKTADGTNLVGIQSFLQQLREADMNISKPSNFAEDYFNNSIKEPYLCVLIDNLKRRFNDKTERVAFSLFNPERLKNGCTMEYGIEEIESLARQYHGLRIIASTEECIDEWKTYRQFLQDNCSKLKLSKVILDLCTNSTTLRIFHNMSTLAKICRVIPIYTADVERTFSQLKLIKTPIHNRMQEQTLDSLLRIAIEGPPFDLYPVKEAVTLSAI